MIEPEEQNRISFLHGGKNAHEYARSIGKTDLKTFTGEEWLIFCECMCKNYHDKYIEITGKNKKLQKY